MPQRTAWAGSGSFTKTIDPIAFALMNAKLADGSYLIPSAQNSNPYVYGVPNVTLEGTSVMTSSQANGAVDWNVSAKDTAFNEVPYYQTDPVTLLHADFSQTGGFPVTQNNGSQVVALDNTIAVTPNFNWGAAGWIFPVQPSYSFFNQTVTNGTRRGAEFRHQWADHASDHGGGPFFPEHHAGIIAERFS